VTPSLIAFIFILDDGGVVAGVVAGVIVVFTIFTLCLLLHPSLGVFNVIRCLFVSPRLVVLTSRLVVLIDLSSSRLVSSSSSTCRPLLLVYSSLRTYLQVLLLWPRLPQFEQSLPLRADVGERDVFGHHANLGGRVFVAVVTSVTMTESVLL
jgi:hypothetical protein